VRTFLDREGGRVRQDVAQAGRQRPGGEQFEQRTGAARELGEREDHAADAEQHHVDEVGRREGSPRRAASPASRSAKPLNAAVPSSTSSGTTTTTAAGLASGDQPSARAISRMMAVWSSSTPMTVAVFCGDQARPRTVASRPSRLSTPYLRSKPVAIAWLVNAVDMTASAITPGVRKSILVYPPPKSISGSRLNAGEQQQRDDQRERELLAVAQQLPGLLGGLRGNHSAQGARRRARVSRFLAQLPLPPLARRGGGSSTSQVPSGEFEEDVLKRA